MGLVIKRTRTDMDQPDYPICTIVCPHCLVQIKVPCGYRLKTIPEKTDPRPHIGVEGKLGKKSDVDRAGKQ